jgi:transposase
MTMQKAIVGIDLALVADHKAVIFTDDLSDRSKFSVMKFSHSLEGFEKLFHAVLKKASDPQKTFFLMEPTGKLWITLSAFLRSQGANVISIKPSLSKEFRKVTSRHAKSDKIDASSLARLFFSLPDILYPVYLPTPDVLLLKTLCDERLNLVNNATALKNRIGEYLRSVYPGILSFMKPGNILSSPLKAFFRKYLDPAKAVKLGQNRFGDFLHSRSRSIRNEKQLEVLYGHICQSAKLFESLKKASLCPLDLENLQKILNWEINQLERLETEIRKVEKQIEPVYERCDPQHVLESIPGIGKTLGPSILSLIGTMDRFANLRKLKGYSGLIPRSCQSSKKTIQGLHITKTANKRLKRDLVLAARTAIYWDAQLAAFAVKKLKQGKHFNQVCIAVAGKLIARIRCLMRKPPEQAKYEFRDEQGNPIDRKTARIRALAIWKTYKNKGGALSSFKSEVAQ